MKQIVFKILLAGLFLLALSSCSDDDLPVFESEIEMENGQDFMGLERVGREYNVNIQTESNATWKASIDGILGYIAMKDTTGTGSKTITFYTTTNRDDADRTASLCITFPESPQSNKTIPLKQMGNLNDSSNDSDPLPTSNKIYAVGYGYDTRGRWADPLSLKAEILRTHELITMGKITTKSGDVKLSTDIVSGSSVTELNNELNASAKVTGGGWGFKGEAGATFDMIDIKTNQYEYAIAYINLTRRSVEVEDVVKSWAEKYMTKEAYLNINGLSEDSIRDDNATRYSSTDEGFDKLISGYGTHLVIKAQLGGQVKYAMKMDISKIEGSYDLEAFAKLSYDGIVKADGSVNDHLKESYKKNSSHIHKKISIRGGNSIAVDSILMQNEELSTYFNNWMGSLNKDENLALIDFEAEDAFIPLYELVDREKYPDRYKDMKKYMKNARSEAIRLANTEYSSGATVMLHSLPTFNDDINSNSLIKDVYNKGQWVGRICNEFIPQLNVKERVTVVYPVSDNKVKYNMGYFVGDSGHKPARVCWEGSKFTAIEYKDEKPVGANDTIYLKGSTISGTCYETPTPATVEDATVSAPGRDGYINYPLVKIFNKIWMRENYAGNSDLVTDDGNVYYLPAGVYMYPTKVFPDRWNLPEANDFISIKETLLNNGIADISAAKAFFSDKEGGRLGFHHINAGYVSSNGVENIGTAGYYICEGKNKLLSGAYATSITFVISKKEDFYSESVSMPGIQESACSIRLVQDINQ